MIYGVYRRPDRVAKDEASASQINVNSCEIIAKAAQSVHAWLLYISTDYVFDGSEPPYKTTDIPNPINDYGKQKLAGEKAVLKVFPNAGILRVPVLYGKVENLQECAISQILDQLLKGSEGKVSDYELRYPTHVQDVANVCRFIVNDRKEKGSVSGVYHFSGNEMFTKYGQMKVMSEVFNLPIQQITPDKSAPSGPATRPHNCQLDISDLKCLGYEGTCTSFRDGIQCFKEFV